MDLKTTSSNANKNSIDNEKSTFERFESELKNTIFSVLFVLLKEDDMNIWWSFVITLIEFFQILIFPFHGQVFTYSFNSSQAITVFCILRSTKSGTPRI